MESLHPVEEKLAVQKSQVDAQDMNLALSPVRSPPTGQCPLILQVRNLRFSELKWLSGNSELARAELGLEPRFVGCPLQAPCCFAEMRTLHIGKEEYFLTAIVHGVWVFHLGLDQKALENISSLLPATPPRPPYQPLELSYDFEEVAGGEARRSLVILIKLPMKSGVFSCAVRCTWLAVRGH